MTKSTKKTYEVIAVSRAPFVMYDEKDGTWTGMFIELLDEIGKRLNCSFNKTLEEGENYGWMDDDGNWSGVMRKLKDKEFDVGVGAISVMSERGKIIDFTEPIYPPVGFSILVRKIDHSDDYFR